MSNMLATFNQIRAINGKYKLPIEAVDPKINDFTNSTFPPVKVGQIL